MRSVPAAAAALLAAQLGPGLASVPWVRRAVAPRLHGLGPSMQVALTFDDGPDPLSTPRFLDLLDRRDVRSTFFLLGQHVAANASLVAEMAAAGHELAVHGWDHRPLVAKRPFALHDEVRRTRQQIEDITGSPISHFRPPYGWMTTEGVLAARREGLQTVLWTAWGRDWSARATPASIVDRVERSLPAGGTVLLHDTDRTSAPGSWRRTLRATDELLDRWHARGCQVGPLGALGGAA